MWGTFKDQGGLFSYISPEARVPRDHPLRKVRQLVCEALGELNRCLDKLYANEGRPSIPPEQLLSALLLRVFYGIRSERQLMEQLDYNLMYRWFVGLAPDDRVWDATTFTKNRDHFSFDALRAGFRSLLALIVLDHASSEYDYDYDRIGGSLVSNAFECLLNKA